MFDFLDIFALMPIGGGRRRGSPEENLAGGIALGIFPTAVFCLVLFTGITLNGWVIFLVLPGLFTVAAYVLCRRLALGAGPTIATTGGCFLMCLCASGGAGLLRAFMDFFTMF
jgi:hypothetical protein